MTDSELERKLDEAYLTLRTMIPGAFRTPLAPTPEQVWNTTERALARLIERLDETEKHCERLERTFNEATKMIHNALNSRPFQ